VEVGVSVGVVVLVGGVVGVFVGSGVGTVAVGGSNSTPLSADEVRDLREIGVFRDSTVGV
jgi:hypothetical protein